MTFGLGVAAALAAPLVMTLGFIAWDQHWKGSAFALNLFKCNAASVGFLVLSCTTRADGPFPRDVFTVPAVGYMILSSTIGIIIGDWTWLEALQMLGARRVILMDSLKPFLAAVLGWMILDEELRPAAFGGIVLTVAGVLLVSLETTTAEVDDNAEGGDNENIKEHGNEQHRGDGLEEQNEIPNDGNRNPVAQTGSTDELSSVENAKGRSGIEEVKDNNVDSPKAAKSQRNLRRGYPYAILNVVLDTYGAVLIKQHGKDFKVWEINLLRFGFAGFFMLLVSLGFSARQAVWPKTTADNDKSSSQTKTNWYALPMAEMTRSSWSHVSLGVLLVTFATPSLTNYALFEIALALALTLGSIGPLYSLPLTYVLQHDPPTVRTCLGALLAVAGVVLLTWKATVVEDE